MFREFLADRRGNYAMLTIMAMVPIMGALALAIDYSDISRQRQETLNALDAAGIATARRIVEGGTDDEIKTYAQDFFEANLTSVKPANAALTVVLPTGTTGGGTLKMSAQLKYQPRFLPVAAWLLGKGSGDETVHFAASSEVRLKNTLEVALVLDNSGSMDETGTGSGKKRLVLLKEAAKQLVDTLAGESSQMKQVQQPVQFGVVPFAASVNIGADKATAAWMDQDGISPVQHENFDWSTMPTSGAKYVEKSGAAWYARGDGWAEQKDKPLTRFSLYTLMQGATGSNTYGKAADWAGCVEARPSPYNVNDAPANAGTPATLFVPMFAPDETDKTDRSGRNRRSASNNYWPDNAADSATDASRQASMPKYFAYGTTTYGAKGGPNESCTTTAILPLTDVGKTAGVTAVKDAIDAMVANGATNVPEGMAWGWRVVSSAAPFTEGRKDGQSGNDKVVIVLTDGANTYYTPESLGYNDRAGNKSIYSSYGYAGRTTPGYSDPRLFIDAPSDVGKTDYSNDNYTRALNGHFATLCANAKAGNLIVMTVSLDLNENNANEKGQIDALRSCASESRFRKDPNDPTKADKNYWNTTGEDLSETFRKIADELSNLRIVS